MTLNGALILGVMDIAGIFSSLAMIIYLFRIKESDDEGQLKSILLHLLFALFVYYCVAGFTSMWRVFVDDEVAQINTIRLIIAVAIFFQLTAFYRLYKYIKK